MLLLMAEEIRRYRFAPAAERFAPCPQAAHSNWMVVCSIPNCFSRALSSVMMPPPSVRVWSAVMTWALRGILYPYFYPAHTGDRSLPDETIQAIVEIPLHGIAQT
jgi:hypothetical protein